MGIASLHIYENRYSQQGVSGITVPETPNGGFETDSLLHSNIKLL
jgi:hypothetical protein